MEKMKPVNWNQHGCLGTVAVAMPNCIMTA